MRTHFLWGLSKDFGLASFRFGVLHSLNSEVIKSIAGMGLFSNVECHIQQISAKMLMDTTWLDEVYFARNLTRLKLAYEDCVKYFEKIGCQVRSSSAGLFAWVNLAPLFKKRQLTFENERQLFVDMFNRSKIYFPNGQEFGCADPGWFRVVFAVRRDNWNEFCIRFDKFVAQLE